MMQAYQEEFVWAPGRVGNSSPEARRQLPRRRCYFCTFPQSPCQRALAQLVPPAAKGQASWLHAKVNMFMPLQTGQSCQKGQAQCWHRNLYSVIHAIGDIPPTATAPDSSKKLRLAWS